MNKPLTIGVDIDGVLTDFENFVLINGKRYFDKKHSMKIIKPNGFDVDQVFGATKQQLRRFWERHYIKYCITQSVRAGARETLSKLKKEDNKIIIITGRMLSYEKNFLGAIMRGSVKFWLWENGIVYDKIIFCPENDLKSKLCKDLCIDVMIEDKTQNILQISKTISTICFNASYNQDCEGENIKRVHNWIAVYQHIKGIAKY